MGPPGADEPSHGEHTLRVVRGEIVGIHGGDVFVQLSPRMQGVIARRRFGEEPRVGDVHEFRVHGQEDGLWALSLESAGPLASWREMEVGSRVRARVLRQNDGGLELKIGPLHAFMPRGHAGLPRDRSLAELVGRELTCEVIEIDPERQRVFVSRKIVLRSERESEHQREVGHLAVGQLVHGHVTRIEPYGAFVAFGKGLEGLVHISNLAHERPGHPADIVHVGEAVEAKILHVRRGGKRIGLGIKQLQESPWKHLERRYYVDQLVEARVVGTAPFGVFLELEPGVVGLLHRSQSLLRPEQPASDIVGRATSLSVRILELDIESERLAFSVLHRSGALIAPEEAAAAREFAEALSAARERGQESDGRRLGDLLRRALGQA